jgi:hypothetical protein
MVTVVESAVNMANLLRQCKRRKHATNLILGDFAWTENNKRFAQDVQVFSSSLVVYLFVETYNNKQLNKTQIIENTNYFINVLFLSTAQSLHESTETQQIITDFVCLESSTPSCLKNYVLQAISTFYSKWTNAITRFMWTVNIICVLTLLFFLISCLIKYFRVCCRI